MLSAHLLICCNRDSTPDSQDPIGKCDRSSYERALAPQATKLRNRQQPQWYLTSQRTAVSDSTVAAGRSARSVRVDRHVILSPVASAVHEREVFHHLARDTPAMTTAARRH
jgi:hypothetical protein